MSNRPNPYTFAEFSYTLAFASAIILLVSVVLGFRLFDAIGFLRNIVWLALFTSAVGTFLAWAARSDFKRHPAPADIDRKARAAFRINLITLILMLLLLVITIVGTVLL
jgi:uncharacterized Tic20 family protein